MGVLSSWIILQQYWVCLQNEDANVLVIHHYGICPPDSSMKGQVQVR